MLNTVLKEDTDTWAYVYCQPMLQNFHLTVLLHSLLNVGLIYDGILQDCIWMHVFDILLIWQKQLLQIEM